MDLLSMIPTFNLDVNNDQININGKPVARAINVNYINPEKPSIEPSWKIQFIPIGDNGAEDQPVNINCKINIQGTTIAILGVEINRRVTFAFHITIEFIRKQCKLTGMYGDRKVTETIRNPIEAISIITNLLKVTK